MENEFLTKFTPDPTYKVEFYHIQQASFLTSRLNLEASFPSEGF